MTNWDREERQRERDLEAVNSDRIHKYDQYWNNLILHNFVTVSYDDEQKALEEDIKLVRKLMRKT